VTGEPGPVWDTSVLSQAAPGMRQHARYSGTIGVATAAPALEEWLYGIHRRLERGTSGERWRTLLSWVGDELSSSRLVVVPLEAEAAALAGQVRAKMPAASLRYDIEIAACAWMNHRAVLTSNRADFDRISAMIVELYPGHDPLVVNASSGH
jgi:predicted nucleic acid-binding protein